MTIPNSVERIGNYAFGECSKLAAINVNAANSYYTSIDGVLFNKTCTELIACPGGRTGACSIPDSVESMETFAFYCCTNITSVTIGNSVKNIGISAFYGCTNLTNVIIGNSVKSIESYAFKNCTNLTNVTIPDSMVNIDREAFWGCKNIASVTIPKSVVSIGIRVFENCSKLTAINVNPANGYYTSIDGVLFNKTCTELIDCPDGRAGAYSVLESVESIGDYAFSDCMNLTSVTIPKSVVSIGDYTFFRCTNLASATMPISVQSIGEGAFWGCTSLASLTIGNSVESIGNFAFTLCQSLTSVTIPNSVSSIEESAFHYCQNLNKAYFEGAAPASMGENAFLDCATDFTIYFIGGQPGWTTPTWHGYRTALWEERAPAPSDDSTHDFEDATYSSDAPSLQPDGSLQYTVNADIGKYVSTSVDGITLGNSDVTVTPGSTIVSIGAAYMAKLPDGAHTLRVQFIDGHADTVFTTSLSAASGAVSIPATGDTPVWTLTIALLCVFSAICVLRRKRA